MVCVFHAPIAIILQSTSLYFGQKSAQPAFHKSHVLHMPNFRLIRQFQMPNSHLLVTYLGVEMHPKFRRRRCRFFSLAVSSFPRFSTDLLGQHLFNLLQPQEKRAATNNKSCFVVQYQTVTLNSFDLLGKTWQVLLTSTFETACELMCSFCALLVVSTTFFGLQTHCEANFQL